MTVLEELENETSSMFIERAHRFSLSQIIVKVFFIIIPSIFIGVAQYNQIVLSDGKINWWNVIGIVASFLVGAGGLISLIVDFDPSKELAAAHRAMNFARQTADDFSKLDQYVGFADQSLQLSHAYSAMRNSLEQTVEDGGSSIEQSIDGLLNVSMRQLEAAAGFEPGNIWTICVYKAVSSQTMELRLVADLRAVPCAKSEARTWPIGVGPAGVALAAASEVVIDDLTDPRLGTTYRLPKDLRREHDGRHYRAVLAVPILVGKEHATWGVVVGSLNAPNHFDQSRFTPRSVASDTIRAVAEMVALLVVARQKNTFNRDQTGTS